MVLFHFTTLVDLPSILRNGITTGEVPLDWYKCENAANLTRNPEPAAQGWADQGNRLNKVRVRITVNLLKDAVQRFVDVMKDRSVKANFLKTIDRAYQRRNWYLAYDGVPADAITKVEVWEDGSYVELAGKQLISLVEKIEKEKAEKLDVSDEYNRRYRRKVKTLRLKKGVADSWLLDGSQEQGRQIPYV